MIVYSNIEQDTIYSEEVDYADVVAYVRITEDEIIRVTEDEEPRLLES